MIAVSRGAVVVAEHYECISTPEQPCADEYTYKLLTVADLPIQPSLDIGSPRDHGHVFRDGRPDLGSG